MRGYFDGWDYTKPYTRSNHPPCECCDMGDEEAPCTCKDWDNIPGEEAEEKKA